ncbi:MAG: hypothetical protein COB66_07570 [Coxiella sp. (in: Bacteria)]|nr:MAG: hypothetical protein COB66_07570 [Coxiella sp. (in: g-proteobacteria)]
MMSQKTIIVINEDKSIRQYYCLALENENYLIHTASSSEEGLQMMISHPPDLIFLDFHMPTINGIETLEMISKINKKVNVYIVTAFHKTYLDKLKRLAADGIYFEVAQNPLDSEQIISICHDVLKH